MNLADRLHLEGLRALQAKDYCAAVGFLDAAVIEDPLIAQAHNNRGLALRLLGRAFDATLAFERAISLNSYYIDAHFNLGAVLQEEGNAASAEHQYRKVVCLDAEHLVAHYSLAEVLAVSERVEEAALHLSMCVSLDPEDRLGASLFLAALDKGPLPAKASKAFIHRLYQRRAVYWDQISGYEAHLAVAHALVEAGSAPALPILDLGCGTGLVGEQLRPISSALYGLDCSEHMLNVAASKNIYDGLYHDDVTEFADKHQPQYDAITAAALLIHFGDLVTILRSVCGRLCAGGAFVFSVYSNDDYDNQGVAPHPELGLAKAGCYAHGSAYVNHTAQQAGLHVRNIVPIIHEASAGYSAPGLVVTLTASN